MAECSKCHTEVGCPCNLHNGYCISCYASIYNYNEPQTNVDLGFNLIVQNNSMTKEEKLRRINKILKNE